MEKFTFGIIAVDTLELDEEDNMAVVHFIGLWEAPTREEFIEYEKEIKTNSDFGLVDIADRIMILPAPQETIDIFNEIVKEKHGMDC